MILYNEDLLDILDQSSWRDGGYNCLAAYGQDPDHVVEEITRRLEELNNAN